MNKRIITAASVFIILVFIGYMIWDTATFRDNKPSETTLNKFPQPEDKWEISEVLEVMEGTLKAVGVSETGILFIGGDSFISSYDNELKQKWTVETSDAITSLSVNGETLYASTKEKILLVDLNGKITEEWGPYEKNSMITSVSSNTNFVAFADAGTKRVFILKKNGEVASMIGHAEEKFIIPSPYFDVALTEDNVLFIANTGKLRIETWTTDGRLLNYFGETGTAPDAFCGCCNPAHFALLKDGFVTAEKGINRIKILNNNGEFVEFVSSSNDFMASIPLDIEVYNDYKVYAANPGNSKLYVFTRK